MLVSAGDLLETAEEEKKKREKKIKKGRSDNWDGSRDFP
jgi:hypothetical protein